MHVSQQPRETRQAMYYKRNTEGRSRNHYFRVKAISITHSKFGSVVLVIQNAKRIRRIISSSMACPALPYFSTLLHKRCDSRGEKSYWPQNMFWFSVQILSKTLLIPRSVQRNLINVHTSSPKVPIILVRLNFLGRFSKNTQMPNFMKILPVGAGSFHADERTVRQTWQS